MGISGNEAASVFPQMVAVSVSGHVSAVTRHKAGPPGALRANRGFVFSISRGPGGGGGPRSVGSYSCGVENGS